MAKHTLNPEDLIRDGVAMVDRAEFVSANHAPIVAGFRRDGACSFYFGDQPVYQFSAERKLRRVFIDGIIKAESGRLIRWVKTYDARGVQMIAQMLDPAEQLAMLTEMQSRLIALRDGIRSGAWKLAREVSQSCSQASARVEQWLEEMPVNFEIADTPNAQ